MESQVQKLLQIGIIVEDIASAVKHYEEILGIGPWHMGHIDPEHMPKLYVDGKQGDLDFKMAMTHHFGMEIELIEPVSDSAYSRWLKEHGPGIHHIAVITKDPFKDVLAKAKEVTGKEPWIWAKDMGAPEGRNMEFAYLDFRKEMGLIMEVYPEHVEKHHEGNIGGHAY